MDFADFMLRTAKQGDQQIESALGALITDSSFNMNAFKQYRRSLADCEEDCTRTTKESMRTDGFQSIVVRGNRAKRDGHRTLNVKDLTEVLRQQVEVCGKEDILFGPESKESSKVFSPNMRTEYI